jgi:hypothetical protein
MSDSTTSSGARIRFVTTAARRSLSPNVVFNSSTLTVSFSLTIGTAPNSRIEASVLRTLR